MTTARRAYLTAYSQARARAEVRARVYGQPRPQRAVLVGQAVAEVR